MSEGAGYVEDKQAVLRGMVEEETYCVDVLTQVAAVGGPEADAKLDELLAAVERFARTR